MQKAIYLEKEYPFGRHSGNMNTKTKVVIFDIFNTLFHNETNLWEDTFDQICQEQKLRLDPKYLFNQWKNTENKRRLERVNMGDPDKSQPFVSYRNMWEECFVSTFVDLGLQGDANAATRTIFKHMAVREPFAETTDMIDYLGRRYTLAVLSNADVDFLHPLLNRHKLSFSTVVCSEEIQAYKPHPKAFQKVLTTLNISSSEAIHVGDSLTEDVQGSINLGLRSAWINRQGMVNTIENLRPDYEFKHLYELKSILNKIPN